MSSTILQLDHVSKSFQLRDSEIQILHDISFQIEQGSSVALVGSSGSGKTTLLGLCAGLDQCTSGEVILNGLSLRGLTEDQLAAVRNQHVGFVFQNFQLLPTLTALENVLVPMELRGMKNSRQRAIELLKKVGLSDRVDHYPSQLSGGEQQRVSIARAFANDPLILFADEPTGNLDADTGVRIENMLFQLNKELGTTLVLVTHDMELANKTERIIRIKGGQIV